MKYIQIIKEALSGKEQEFTKGNINKAIVLLSIPMVIEMFGEGLFEVVDAYFVGKINAEAVNAVGLTGMAATFIYSLAVGISIAITAMVARRIGEGNKATAATAAVQGMVIGAIVALIIAVFGVLYAPNILRFMGATEAVIAEGVTYTRIFFGTNIFIVFLFVLNGIFRGSGDAMTAMYALWIANGLNMILDPIFIFGLGPIPEMGATGAGLASAIGRGTGVLFQLYILFFGAKIIQITKENLKVVPALFKRLLNVASTGAGQFILSSASWVFLSIIVSTHFGEAVFAGYIQAIRVALFILLPAIGVANAAATLVGQNLGAKQPERAATSVWRAAYFNVCFLFVIGVIFAIFAEPIMQPFTAESGAIATQTSVTALRMLCAGFVFYAFGMVLSQAFGGAGDTRTPTMINFICFWLIEMPLAYFLGVTMGYEIVGILGGILIAEIALSVIAFLLFKQGKWKLKEI